MPRQVAFVRNVMVGRCGLTREVLLLSPTTEPMLSCSVECLVVRGPFLSHPPAVGSGPDLTPYQLRLPGAPLNGPVMRAVIQPP